MGREVNIRENEHRERERTRRKLERERKKCIGKPNLEEGN